MRERGWKQIVETKTKRTTGLSILRWTLLRHLTGSLNRIEDEQTKKNILWQEMFWLNDYYGQMIPKKNIAPKYWQRLFQISSLHVRRDLYESVFPFSLVSNPWWFEDICTTTNNVTNVIVIEWSNVKNIFLILNLKTILGDRRSSLHLLLNTILNVGWISSPWLEPLVSVNSSSSTADSNRRTNDIRISPRWFNASFVVSNIWIVFILLRTSWSPISGRTSKPENILFLTNIRVISNRHAISTSISSIEIDSSIWLRTRPTKWPISIIKPFMFSAESTTIRTKNRWPIRRRWDRTFDMWNYPWRNISRRRTILSLPSSSLFPFRFHSTSSRALAFHEVYNILLTLKHTNDNWSEAFRYVPKRKIATRLWSRLNAGEWTTRIDRRRSIDHVRQGFWTFVDLIVFAHFQNIRLFDVTLFHPTQPIGPHLSFTLKNRKHSSARRRERNRPWFRSSLEECIRNNSNLSTVATRRHSIGLDRPEENIQSDEHSSRFTHVGCSRQSTGLETEKIEDWREGWGSVWLCWRCLRRDSIDNSCFRRFLRPPVQSENRVWCETASCWSCWSVSSIVSPIPRPDPRWFPLDSSREDSSHRLFRRRNCRPTSNSAHWNSSKQRQRNSHFLFNRTNEHRWTFDVVEIVLEFPRRSCKKNQLWSRPEDQRRMTKRSGSSSDFEDVVFLRALIEETDHLIDRLNDLRGS